MQLVKLLEDTCSVELPQVVLVGAEMLATCIASPNVTLIVVVMAMFVLVSVGVVEDTTGGVVSPVDVLPAEPPDEPELLSELLQFIAARAAKREIIIR